MSKLGVGVAYYVWTRQFAANISTNSGFLSLMDCLIAVESLPRDSPAAADSLMDRCSVYVLIPTVDLPNSQEYQGGSKALLFFSSLGTANVELFLLRPLIAHTAYALIGIPEVGEMLNKLKAYGTAFSHSTLPNVSHVDFLQRWPDRCSSKAPSMDCKIRDCVRKCVGQAGN